MFDIWGMMVSMHASTKIGDVSGGGIGGQWLGSIIANVGVRSCEVGCAAGEW